MLLSISIIISDVSQIILACCNDSYVFFKFSIIISAAVLSLSSIAINCLLLSLSVNLMLLFIDFRSSYEYNIYCNCSVALVWLLALAFNLPVLVRAFSYAIKNLRLDDCFVYCLYISACSFLKVVVSKRLDNTEVQRQI